MRPISDWRNANIGTSTVLVVILYLDSCKQFNQLCTYLSFLGQLFSSSILVYYFKLFFVY